MKVRLLGDTASSRAPLELHPRITLVRDADPARRSWLVSVLGQLGGGGDVDATGEVEAHGIRFDLDAASLALLGLDRPAAAVVGAADLPGFDAASVDAARAVHDAVRRRDELAGRLDEQRGALAAAVEQRDAAAEALDELLRGEGPAGQAMADAAVARARLELELQAVRDERARQEAALTRAVDEREEAIAERSRLRTQLDVAQNRRRVAMAEATQAAASLEEARSVGGRDDDPAAVAASAEARLDAAEQAAAVADPEADGSPLNRRLADLERRRVELARLEVALGDGGSESVAAALDEVLGASSDAPPLVAALALADTWRDLHQQIDALEAGVSDDERAAEADVAAARQAVVVIEAELNQPVLTPEQISKVEAAHTAVLEAEDRAEGRFGGARARRRLGELRTDEHRVLERLGFATYADFMVSVSDRGVTSADRSGLDEARLALVAAEERLLVLPGAGDRVRRRIELLQRRDAVSPRVADLLGHEPTGPEAEDELRGLREPVPADHEALDVLATHLTRVGIDVGPGPHEREDLVLLARSFLAEERSAEAQRTDVAKAIAALDVAVDDLRAARGRGETEVPDHLPLPALAEPVPTSDDGLDPTAARTLREARWAEVESARAALSEARSDLADHEAAAARVAARQAALDEAVQAEAQAADAVAAAQDELGAGAEHRVSMAAAGVAAAEAALADARSREHQVGEAITATQGTTGAEPLVRKGRQWLAVAEGVVREVAVTEQTIAAGLAATEVELDAARRSLGAAQEVAAAVDRDRLVDDIEWWLLARLAELRSVGLGGSLPLVLDDPFPDLGDHEVVAVLDRVAQLAGAVQVIVVSDRQAVASWAADQGPDVVGIVDAA